MNGAESLVRTLLASGVDTCFTNPGTSEMHFVAALDRISGMRCILGLHENVVTGAADGYARMQDRPAATLLHCGPGLANGLANLHNARRARTPIINIVGDQADYHTPLDPPLASDTEGWARPVSSWTKTAVAAEFVGNDAAICVQAAANGVATLILPSNTCWDEGGVVAQPLPRLAPPPIASSAVETAARLLRSGAPTFLLVAGKGLRQESLRFAQAIVNATGCEMFAPISNARIERGAGGVAIKRLPYSVEECTSALAHVENLILVGAKPPVSFFAYPGKPGRMYPPTCVLHTLARPDQDPGAALRLLAEELGADEQSELVKRGTPEAVGGIVTAAKAATTVATLLPENSIVIDESGSIGDFFPATEAAAPHDWLQITGAAIGCGIPLAVGAAVGAPERRVVALQADGSALYTVSGLWTQARENLDVTTVILSNRKYAILLGEYKRVGANPGSVAFNMMDLSNPELDWVKIGEGMGVESARADTIERFHDLLETANARRGPFLIELVL